MLLTTSPHLSLKTNATTIFLRIYQIFQNRVYFEHTE